MAKLEHTKIPGFTKFIPIICTILIGILTIETSRVKPFILETGSPPDRGGASSRRAQYHNLPGALLLNSDEAKDCS